ncbi:MAG: hypothetical protein ACRDBG_19390, partial [Waterburya sp.]
RAKLPLNELKPVPAPQFQTELASLKQAQFNLDAIVSQINNFDQKIYHKDPWHVQVFESEKVQELADLKRRELEASINLEKAMPMPTAATQRLAESSTCSATAIASLDAEAAGAS